MPECQLTSIRTLTGHCSGTSVIVRNSKHLKTPPSSDSLDSCSLWKDFFLESPVFGCQHTNTIRTPIPCFDLFQPIEFGGKPEQIEPLGVTPQQNRTEAGIRSFLRATRARVKTCHAAELKESIELPFLNFDETMIIIRIGGRDLLASLEECLAPCLGDCIQGKPELLEIYVLMPSLASTAHFSEASFLCTYTRTTAWVETASSRPRLIESRPFHHQFESERALRQQGGFEAIQEHGFIRSSLSGKRFEILSPAAPTTNTADAQAHRFAVVTVSRSAKSSNGTTCTPDQP